MSQSSPALRATICIFTSGDRQKQIDKLRWSIQSQLDVRDYVMIAGAHDIPEAVEQDLRMYLKTGVIREVYAKFVNRPPTLARMFSDLESEFVWWFDDSFEVTTSNSLGDWIAVAQAASPEVAMWVDERGSDCGNCWMARTSVIQKIIWPETEITGYGSTAVAEDAIRQTGARIERILGPGVEKIA